MYIFLLFIFSTTLFSQSITQFVNFSSSQNKQIDLSFHIKDTKIREIGVIEILDENSSPANISYLEYDEVLVQKFGLKTTKFPNNGQVEFFGNSMTSENWTALFKTVRFKAPKLSTSIKDTLVLKIPRMYKHNRNVRWNDGKLICESKGMRIPTKLEFQKVVIPNGEYWTNRESGNSAYFFRPPNWTQTMQKNNDKALYCIGDDFDIKKEKIPEVYTHNGKQEKWDYGKKICEDKGMKLPTIDELKALHLGHGEYWTSKEAQDGWAYMFRPPSWTQTMQKQNDKKLVCVRKAGAEISQNFKVIFTVKKVEELIDKDLKIGAIPTKPETLDSLKTTLDKWKHSEVTKKAFKGDVLAKLTIVNSAKIYKGLGKGFFVEAYKNTPFLAFHVSTGLGVNSGQILWREKKNLEAGGIADRIEVTFDKPLVDTVVGFTGLGSRFIDSAKAVYEFYYKGKLVRSRGKLDRSLDFDGDGFVATNITFTNVPIDKMIFTIEIDNDNKKSANYSIRYIVGNYLDSDVVTRVYNIQINPNNTKTIGDEVKKDENLTVEPKEIKSYSFKIMDSGKPKNIMTKISGNNFNLDLYSYKKDINTTSSKLELQDLNGTVELKFINSDIPNKRIIFNNENKKVISLTAVKSSKNIGIEIIYKNESSFSEDNFSIRPASFEINSSDKVISGNDFVFQVKAVDSHNVTIPNYNAKIILNYNENKANCLTGRLDISDIQFQNGLSTQNAQYSEIGNVTISLKENSNYEFAKVDRNDGSDNNRFIPTSSKNIKFQLAQIKLNSELTDFENNYTYISNNLDSSSAKLTSQIIVYNSQNEIVKNYSQNCYAEEYNFGIEFDVNTTNKNLTIIYSDKIKLVTNPLYLSEKLFANDFYFGTGTKTVNLNFQRATNKPLNPIYLKLVDGNSSQNRTANFYFARFKIPNYITSESSVNIDYNYLIYSSEKPTNQKVFGDFLKDSLYQNEIWYKHNEANLNKYQNVISLNSNNLNIQDKLVSLKSLESSAYKEYTIQIVAPKYLLYSSCCDYNMTETFFNIEFITKYNYQDSTNEEELQNIIEYNKTTKKPENRINFNYRTTW